MKKYKGGAHGPKPPVKDMKPPKGKDIGYSKGKAGTEKGSHDGTNSNH
jgi:hypothetical protein